VEPVTLLEVIKTGAIGYVSILARMGHQTSVKRVDKTVMWLVFEIKHV